MGTFDISLYQFN